MTRWLFRWTTLVALLALTATGVGQAHGRRHLHLSGLIADTTVPSFGAWVVRGPWSLDAEEGPNGELTHARFTASLTMERSDYWLVANPAADPELLATRNAHTHHIVATGPVAPATGGFELTAPATITLNGGSTPFGASSVIVDVTGGTKVQYSNVKLTFGGGAIGHFGSLPIAGVVRLAERHDGHDSDDGPGDRDDRR